MLSAGLLAARVLRRGAALQSAILRTTLAVVLFCPLVSWAVGAIGLERLVFDLPLTVTPIENSLGTAGRAVGPQSTMSDRVLPGPVGVYESPVAIASHEPAVEFADTSEKVSAMPASYTLSIPARPAPTRAEWVRINVVLTLAWALGSLILLARLVLSHFRVARRRRRAVVADVEITETCRAAAEALGMHPPAVLVSADVVSPCLTGLLRPAGLLPPDVTDADRSALRQVFLHELAHFARRDCAWNLLSRVVTAALFFQPLLWHLTRRIARTSDDVCDDHAVQHIPDRRAYAHQLVELVERTLYGAPEITAGVGMISCKYALSSRVARILDQSRTLSLRAGAKGVVTVGLLGLGAALLSSLVGFGVNAAASVQGAGRSQPGATVSLDGIELGDETA